MENYEERRKKMLLILSKAYLSNLDMAYVLGISPSTVSREIKKRHLKKVSWGVYTVDFIDSFGLHEFVKRLERG